MDGIKSLKRPRSPDWKDEVYVRKPYVRKPYVRVEPTATYSKPRETAGHVSRRGNRGVAALPPPSSKAKLINTGAGDKREQDEEEIGERNENKEDDDDDGDENEEEDNHEQQSEAQQSDEESDDDFASATSSPWPEEIWNDAPSDEVLAALDRHKQEVARANKGKEIIPLITERSRIQRKQEAEFRNQKDLNGPGWRKYSGMRFGMVAYQLFAKGDLVLRYTHPPPGEKINAAAAERMDISDLYVAGWVRARESSDSHSGTLEWAVRNEVGDLKAMASLPARLEDIPLLTSSALRDICSRDY